MLVITEKKSCGGQNADVVGDIIAMMEEVCEINCGGKKGDQ